jgi:hypothetical protein
MGDPEKLVTAGIFHTRPEAELAQMRLREAGIDAIVQTDNAGGMYPQFDAIIGIKLKVRAADEEQARELLAPAERSGQDGPGFDDADGDGGGDGDGGE